MPRLQRMTSTFGDWKGLMFREGNYLFHGLESNQSLGNYLGGCSVFLESREFSLVAQVSENSLMWSSLSAV